MVAFLQKQLQQLACVVLLFTLTLCEALNVLSHDVADDCRRSDFASVEAHPDRRPAGLRTWALFHWLELTVAAVEDAFYL